ncbi:MAG TPA: hypothetical protein VEC36_07210, partial [Patescibacteria group bacterium]|nr:hypothetical protein [Patescibacteria group bacterium]
NSGGVQLTFGPRPRQVIREGAERCLVSPQGPMLLLQNPLGNTRIVSGSTEEIRWTSARASAVNIEYSTDKGQSWIAIAQDVPAITRRYLWQTPAENYSEVLVRIYDPLKPNVGDTSITTFSVQKPVIALKKPSGGEKIGFSEVLDISWTKDLVERVHVDYSPDAGKTWKRIVSGHNESLYRWNVADTVTDQGMIRIVSANDNTLISQSGVFSVNRPHAILISPNGGEKWQGNSTQKIQWVSDYVRRVVLEFSLDNGQTWRRVRLAPINADSGSFTWRLPDTTSGSAMVRILNDADRTQLVASSGAFSIIDSVMTSITNDAGGAIPVFGIERSSISTNGSRLTLAYSSSSSFTVKASIVSASGKSLPVNSIDEIREGAHTIDVELHNLSQGAYYLVLNGGMVTEYIYPFTIIR